MTVSSLGLFTSLQAYFFFLNNPSNWFSLSLSSSKIIFLWTVYRAISSISLDTLHPCEKWKISPLKLEFVEICFSEKSLHSARTLSPFSLPPYLFLSLLSINISHN